MDFKTIHDVEEYAASQGLALSPAERRKISEVMNAERARLIETTPQSPATFADRFNAFYPRLLEFVISLGETLLTFAQTIIVSLGVPLVLVLLLIVEHQRVVHGIALFEHDYALASFAAAALVLLNLVLEFQVHYVEHSSGYHAERAQKWSLRIWLKNAAYTAGLGDDWTAQVHSPAHRYRVLLRLVTFSILSLALAGSMRSVIESTPGAWYEALITIITQSDLITILTWAGGLLFAAAAVLSAQGLSSYVAIRCVEIISQMESRQQSTLDPHASAVESAGASVALAMVNEKLAKKAAKKPVASVEAVVVEPRPFGSIHPTEGDPESIQMIELQHAKELHVSANGNGKH